MKNFALLSAVIVATTQAVNLTAEAESSSWGYDELMHGFSDWEPETIQPRLIYGSKTDAEHHAVARQIDAMFDTSVDKVATAEATKQAYNTTGDSDSDDVSDETLESLAMAACNDA